ncbi:hypothetical protein F2Q69_00038827 [Brassica cretica]|uniref:Uncharacterized protein n=1 Tax=Brassica cretica TaxID=69181 RepID=A0A8S9SRJ2_BRACR|nr:hypothetical protein F2Q69_00038827 [Brassica cretica]
MSPSFIRFARGLRISLPMVAPLLESCRREVDLRAGASPRCGTSLQMPTSLLLFARGLQTSLRLGRSDSQELSTGCWFGAGTEPRCKRSRWLRFVWSGCRRSLPLPAPVLYSLKQHFSLPFLIPNAYK